MDRQWVHEGARPGGEPADQRGAFDESQFLARVTSSLARCGAAAISRGGSAGGVLDVESVNMEPLHFEEGKLLPF